MNPQKGGFPLPVFALSSQTRSLVSPLSRPLTRPKGRRSTDPVELRPLHREYMSIELLQPAVCSSELTETLCLAPMPLLIREGEVISFLFD